MKNLCGVGYQRQFVMGEYILRSQAEGDYAYQETRSTKRSKELAAFVATM